jgi:hypothetical protein
MKVKPDLSFWKLWNISFGFFGVQIAYALQSANIRYCHHWPELLCNPLSDRQVIKHGPDSADAFPIYL